MQYVIILNKNAHTKYLQTLQQAGILNVEMESIALALLCLKTGIRAAICCVSLVDRL